MDYGIEIDLWAAGCVVAEVVRIRLGSERRDWTLFDAGELGSELALVKSIFETLGTPNEERWPVSSLHPFVSGTDDTRKESFENNC